MNFTSALAVPNQAVGSRFYNKLEVIVPYPHGLTVGQSVRIQSAKYTGIHKVAYIYNNTAKSIAGIYFDDVEFTGNDTGTISTDVTASASQTSLPIVPDINPNPGASSGDIIFSPTTPVIKAAETQTPQSATTTQQTPAATTQAPQTVTPPATTGSNTATDLFKNQWVQIGLIVFAGIVLLKLLKSNQ